MIPLRHRSRIAYDANGNQRVTLVRTGSRTTYAWTNENQIAAVARPTGEYTTLTYAPVTRSADEYRVVTQRSSTNFVKHFWDRNNIVLETNNPGTVTAEFTVVPEEYGDLVSDRRSGATRQFHYDGLGSTAALTDGGQTATNTYQYSAFGTLLSGTGTGTNPEPSHTTWLCQSGLAAGSRCSSRSSGAS